MKLVRIDGYDLLYSSNSFMPRILLKGGEQYIGQIIFAPNESVLPVDTTSDSQITLYYYLDDYKNVVDLLRNEEPLYLLYNGSGSGFENGITTIEETVGEGKTKETLRRFSDHHL